MNELLAIIATVMRASSHRFVGRLGKDPEVRFLDGGKSVANGRIAINVPGSKQGDGKEPDWFQLDVWGEQGQAFADQCRKGDLVEVVGRVRTNRWTDRNTGAEKLDLVVTVDAWSLVASRAAAAAPAAAPAPAPTAAPAAAPAQHPAYAAAGYQPQAQPAPAAAPPVWVSTDDIPF